MRLRKIHKYIFLFIFLSVCCIPVRASNKQVLHGYVLASAVKNVEFIGLLSDTTHLNLQIGLSLHNGNLLDNLISDIYNPASPNFRKYLNTKQFTEMFSPTVNDYQKVINFMKANGFEITGTFPNRIVVDVFGSVKVIEKTFHVKIGVYKDTLREHSFYAPDIPTSVEGLKIPISDVIGLDNFSPPHPIDLRKPKPGEKPVTTGSGPGGLFIGKDYRDAYAPGVSLDGTGQYVGLFEFGPYWQSDIVKYEDQAGLRNIKIINILLDKKSSVPGTNEDVGEESLDIENALSMAPGSTLLVYIGSSAVDILSRIASDNKAKQISCSFGWYPPSNTEEQLYKELDAQGQAFFVASGDGGAYADTVQIFSPDDNPYIVSVGGTNLVTAGPSETWISETAWNGSGGGISKTFLSPSYQAGVGNSSNQGSRTYRDFPDVSATAAYQFYFVYNNGKTGGIGGTSGAAPLWAGFTALINEQAVKHGKPVAGFINPALYSIGKGKNFSYNPDLHDITIGNNMSNKSPDRFTAVPGYDLVTGWGSPNGIYTINALAGITSPDFSLSLPQQILTVNQLSDNQFTVNIKSLNGFNGNVNLSASKLPDGVMALFNKLNSNNSAVLTLKTSLDANTGTSTFLISGNSDSLTHLIAVNLVINAAPTATTQINLSPYFDKFNGIANDGSTFQGGLDYSGFAYSGNLLGTSVNWNNTPFKIGQPNKADFISAKGETILLPTGYYAGFRMLAAGVNGSQVAQKFKISYSDTTTFFTQSFSDWYSPSNFPGENIAVTMPYRVSSNGSKDNRTFYLYGYSIKLDPSRKIRSVTLPVNKNLVILAMTLAAPVDTASSVSSFELAQNYPNPFNLVTTIRYKLRIGGIVKLKVYDVLGREVATLVNKQQSAGSYSVIFSGAKLASGVYFYRLQSGSFSNTKKLILLK